MLITNITLKNYGVFKAVSLDFGASAHGISFLNGNNGRGKTTLLDSLKWCLYGETQPKVARSSIRSSSQDDEIEVQVEITFDLGSGESAKVKKTQYFRSRGASNAPVPSTQPDLEVKTTTDNPLDGTTVQPNPQAWLTKRLPRRFMNFVLFDGEQMAKFFDLRTQVAIKEAVLEIAGVDALDKVIETYTEIMQGLERKIARESGGDTNKLQEELEKKRTFAKLLAEEILRDKNRRLEIDIRVEEIDNLLGESKNLEAKVNRLRALKPLFETAVSNTRDAENNLFILTRNLGPQYLLEASFEKMESEVIRAEAEGWLPPDFAPESLQILVDAGKCICGCDLGENPTHKKVILGLISGVSESSEIGKKLQAVWSGAQVAQATLRASVLNLRSANTHLMNARAEQKKLRDEQRVLEDDLIGLDQDQIADLTTERRKLTAEHEELIRASVGQENDAARTAKEIAKQSNDIQKSLQVAGKHEEDNKLIQLSGDLVRAANVIRAEAISEVRASLEATMDADLNNLKQGQYRVVITDDFEISVNLSDGDSPSEGEQMLLAYSFAMALRSVLNMEFPLIVDTPFGRLDNPNRSWLSAALARLVDTTSNTGTKKQAVFFMHDAEFTPLTMDKFKDSNPLTVYLDHDPVEKITELKQGIDPSWLTYEGPWMDWAKANNK